MLRSTKIVATLGPSSSEPAVLERMVIAGVDVVRLNFSHGTADDHLKRAAVVKEIASKVGRTVSLRRETSPATVIVSHLPGRRVVSARPARPRGQ